MSESSPPAQQTESGMAGMEAAARAMRDALGPAISDEDIQRLLQETGGNATAGIELYFTASETPDGPPTPFDGPSEGLTGVDVHGSDRASDQPPKGPGESGHGGAPADERPDSLGLLRTMLGDDVDESVLRYFLDEAQGDVELAVNNFFSADGVMQATRAPEASRSRGKSAHKEDKKSSFAAGLAGMKEKMNQITPGVKGAMEKVLPKLTTSTAPGSAEGALGRRSQNGQGAGERPEGRVGSQHAESMANPGPQIGASADDEAGGEEEYTVVLRSRNPGWALLLIFGRVVVQSVDEHGAAAAIGIKKGDVLTNASSITLHSGNAGDWVNRLTSSNMRVPIELRFRRSSSSRPGRKNAEQPRALPALQDEGRGNLTQRRIGLRGLQSALDEMAGQLDSPARVEVLLHFLSDARGDISKAVTMYQQSGGLMPDFRNIVGRPRDPATAPAGGGTLESAQNTNDTWQTMTAKFTGFTMGITVENIMERTVVVSVKEGGEAAKAGVPVNSLVVAVNRKSVMHMTHKETLRYMNEKPRPVYVEFRSIPEEQLQRLRDQLSLSVRPLISEDRDYGTGAKQRTTLTDLLPVFEQLFSAMTPSARQRLCERLGLLDMFPSERRQHRGSSSGDGAKSDTSGVAEGDQAMAAEASQEAVTQPGSGVADGAAAAAAGALSGSQERLSEDSMSDASDLSGSVDSDMEGAADEELAHEELNVLSSFFRQVHNVPAEESRAMLILIDIVSSVGAHAPSVSYGRGSDAAEYRRVNPALSSPARTPAQKLQYMKRRAVSFTRDLDPRYLSLCLSVLEGLLRVDSTVIWYAVVSALKIIVERFSDMEVVRYVVPLMARLSVSEFPTSRAATVALFSEVHIRVDSELKVQLRGSFGRMVQDESDIVRGTAARLLKEAAQAVDPPNFHWLVFMLERQAVDTNVHIRCLAVENCAFLVGDIMRRLKEYHEQLEGSARASPSDSAGAGRAPSGDSAATSTKDGASEKAGPAGGEAHGNHSLQDLAAMSLRLSAEDTEALAEDLTEDNFQQQRWLMLIRIVAVITNVLCDDSAYEVREAVCSCMPQFVANVDRKFVDSPLLTFSPLLRDNASSVRAMGGRVVGKLAEAFVKHAVPDPPQGPQEDRGGVEEALQAMHVDEEKGARKDANEAHAESDSRRGKHSNPGSASSSRPPPATSSSSRSDSVDERDQPLPLSKARETVLHSILPGACALLSDNVASVRRAVAQGIGELPVALGPELTMVQLLPLFLQLFEDPDSTVRLALAESLCENARHLHRSMVMEHVYPMLTELAANALWRNRQAMLRCLEALMQSLAQEGRARATKAKGEDGEEGEVMSLSHERQTAGREEGAAAMDGEQAEAAADELTLPREALSLSLKALSDTVAEVRESAARTLVATCSLGSCGWWHDQVIPHLLSCLHSDFQSRMVALETLKQLAVGGCLFPAGPGAATTGPCSSKEHLSDPEEKASALPRAVVSLLEALEEKLHDKVPNVRMRASAALVEVLMAFDAWRQRWSRSRDESRTGAGEDAEERLAGGEVETLLRGAREELRRMAREDPDPEVRLVGAEGSGSSEDKPKGDSHRGS